MKKSRKTAAKIELATTRRTSLSWYKLRNSGLSRTPYRTEVSPRVVINLRIDTWQDVSWATSSGDSPSSGNIFGCYFGVGKKTSETWMKFDRYHGPGECSTDLAAPGVVALVALRGWQVDESDTFMAMRCQSERVTWSLAQNLTS